LREIAHLTGLDFYPVIQNAALLDAGWLQESDIPRSVLAAIPRSRQRDASGVTAKATPSQRASDTPMLDDRRADFPTPVAVLRARKIWLLDEVEASQRGAATASPGGRRRSSPRADQSP